MDRTPKPLVTVKAGPMKQAQTEGDAQSLGEEHADHFLERLSSIGFGSSAVSVRSGDGSDSPSEGDELVDEGEEPIEQLVCVQGLLHDFSSTVCCSALWFVCCIVSLGPRARWCGASCTAPARFQVAGAVGE